MSALCTSDTPHLFHPSSCCMVLGGEDNCRWTTATSTHRVTRVLMKTEMKTAVSMVTVSTVGKPDALQWLGGRGHLSHMQRAWCLILCEVWDLASPGGQVNGSNLVRTLVQLAGGVSSQSDAPRPQAGKRRRLGSSGQGKTFNSEQRLKETKPPSCQSSTIS